MVPAGARDPDRGRIHTGITKLFGELSLNFGTFLETTYYPNPVDVAWTNFEPI